MSRHSFEAEVKGKKVNVVVGFDRPLQELFFQVLDMTGENEEPVVDSSMHRPGWNPFSLEELIEALAENGITLPPELKQKLEQEMTAGR